MATLESQEEAITPLMFSSLDITPCHFLYILIGRVGHQVQPILEWEGEIKEFVDIFLTAMFCILDTNYLHSYMQNILAPLKASISLIPLQH